MSKVRVESKEKRVRKEERRERDGTDKRKNMGRLPVNRTSRCADVVLNENERELSTFTRGESREIGEMVPNFNSKKEEGKGKTAKSLAAQTFFFFRAALSSLFSIFSPFSCSQFGNHGLASPSPPCFHSCFLPSPVFRRFVFGSPARVRARTSSRAGMAEFEAENGALLNRSRHSHIILTSSEVTYSTRRRAILSPNHMMRELFSFSFLDTRALIASDSIFFNVTPQGLIGRVNQLVLLSEAPPTYGVSIVQLTRGIWEGKKEKADRRFLFSSPRPYDLAAASRYLLYLARPHYETMRRGIAEGSREPCRARGGRDTKFSLSFLGLPTVAPIVSARKGDTRSGETIAIWTDDESH